jgi:light-harvesting complex I chlorophyll a/b binding protein 1
MGEGQDSQPVLEFLGGGGVPGDYGFDPLKLADKDLHLFSATDRAMQVIRTEAFADRAPELVLRDYRDAEIRHGRLAMMAAVAWPVQEIVAPVLGRFFNEVEGIPGLSDVLSETGGRSPSVLNGGLENGVVPFFLFVRATTKSLHSSTMVVLAPITLLCQECYAYYLFSWYGNLHCS